jgi:hypothetical protein
VVRGIHNFKLSNCPVATVSNNKAKLRLLEKFKSEISDGISKIGSTRFKKCRADAAPRLKPITYTLGVSLIFLAISW